RVMTSSSSPGISLKQEGISYMAGSQLPCVIVNMMRGGPGLGTIQPAQGDYFQAVKGGGHGDYRLVVLAPATVQEMVNLTIDAFDIADRYRNPVMILGDGMLGQMMEPVTIPETVRELPAKPWATVGTGGKRQPNIINSLFMQPEECEKHNQHLQSKYEQIEKNEVRYEIYKGEDAEVFLVAYGTTARIAKTTVDNARREGLPVGLIRPISLFPFPNEAFDKVAGQAKAFLTVEMSSGQMVEDVRLAVNGRQPVHFHGRTGGMVPSPKAILEQIRTIWGGKK
ncbi:MAG: 3-methyl-2-oxobutanoate dehydrogenase subunit VorB, partial [Bacillota bacterium]